jgi:pilus assembly protein CpaC
MKRMKYRPPLSALALALTVTAAVPLSAQQSAVPTQARPAAPTQAQAPAQARPAAPVQAQAPAQAPAALVQAQAPAAPTQAQTGLQPGEEISAPAVQLYMAPAWQPPQDLESSFHFHVGEARVIKLPKQVIKSAVGNGKVLSVAVLNANELLMIASDAGRSTLHLWLKDGSEISYSVEVALDSPSKIYAQVKEAFGDDSGIQVSLVGNRVFLRAQTLAPGQMNLIKALQKAFDDKIVLITEGDEALEERTVHVTAQLVEIKKSALEKLGVDWSGAIHGPSLAVVGDMKRLQSKDGAYWTTRPTDSGAPSMEEWPGYTQPFKAAFSLATMISSKINILRAQGDAYVVAEPRLTARCGGKADFTSGGEMPIPQQNGLGSSSVEFKKYGVRLSIEPKCDKIGNIRAKVATEVSQIDNAVAVMGVPGLLTRQAESELDLVDGRAMLLSGLASYEAGKSENKVPFLGSIPLLGHLFKSSDTDGGRSELIVIITPSFVTSDSDIVRNSVKRSGQLSGETEESLLNRGLKPLDEKEKAAAAKAEAAAAKAAAAAQSATAETRASSTQAQARFAAYTVTGDAPWRPIDVYSDGRRTIIEMPGSISERDVPTLLVVQENMSKATPVNYRFEQSRYVIDAVLDRAVLVAGAGYYRESVVIARQP